MTFMSTVTGLGQRVLSRQRILPKLPEQDLGAIATYLYANSWILEDLRETRIPDRYLQHCTVGFISHGDRIYTGQFGGPVSKGFSYGLERFFLFNHDDEPDLKDFVTTEVKIAKEIGGKIGDIDIKTPYASEDNPFVRYHVGVQRIIDLEKPYTQRQIAEFIEKLRHHFGNGELQGVCFKKVPEYVYKNSGLPPEKLEIIIL